MRRLLEEWPEIKAPRVTEILREDYGYAGSVDLVKRAAGGSCGRAAVRPAQRTGYRPGQVLQVDWAEMPTRPRIAGRERRVYALICALPFSGASTAHFSFDMTVESFLEGHVRAFEWLGRRPARVRLRQPALGGRAPRRRRSHLEPAVLAAARPLRLPRAPPARRRRRARRARSRARSATSRPGSGRRGGSARWPSSTSVYADWRDRIALPRRHATGRLRRRRAARARARGAAAVAAGRLRRRRAPRRRGCRWTAISSTAGSFYRAPEALVHQRVELRWDRDRVWIEHRGETRRALRAQLRRRAAGSRRRGCGPSRRAPAPADPDRRARRSSRRSWATTPSSAHDRDQDGAVGERLPYLLGKLKAPRVLERLEQTADAGARGGLALRAVPRGAARGRGLRARRLRRAPAHPPRRASPPTRRSRTSTSPPSPAPRSR